MAEYSSGLTGPRGAAGPDGGRVRLRPRSAAATTQLEASDSLSARPSEYPWVA